MTQDEGRALADRWRRHAEMTPPELAAARAFYSDLASGFPLPEKLHLESAGIGALAAEWCRPDSARRDAVLLYLHGGGYVTGSLRAYRHLVADLAARLGLSALSIDYRLAPEAPFPAAVEDAVAAYEYLLERGIAPERIVIAGDSAGGGLAMALLLSLRDAQRPLPAACWLISPWTDLTLSGETMVTHAPLEAVLFRERIAIPAALYLGQAPADTALASPIFADLTGLPPIRIDAGAHETLLSDSLRLAEKAALANVMMELGVWPFMPHIFPYFAPISPTGSAAMKAGAGFLARHLAA